MTFSDASDTGYGRYVVELGNEVSHGLWSEAEASLNSTWRELKAIHNVLLSFAAKLQGHKIKWFTDNQAVQSVVTNGSRRLHLQDGALSIFELCMRFSIRLEMEWIPRGENEQADFISRIIDFDDWKIDPHLFEYFDSLWGPHSVDCFASFYNAQIPRFFSRFWNPGSEAVDAFTVSWKGEICWWVPPLHLVIRVIKHARACSAVGTLVVPAWKSAPFWPVICPDGIHFASFIHQWEVVKYYDGMCSEGRSGHNIGSAFDGTTLILVLHFKFCKSPRC